MLKSSSSLKMKWSIFDILSNMAFAKKFQSWMPLAWNFRRPELDWYLSTSKTFLTKDLVSYIGMTVVNL